jgi:hypothetical protein
MKNVIKFFSIMLVAGSILASCTEKPEAPVTPVKPKYTVTVTSNNDAFGTVTGGGTYDSAAVVTLTATANEGYKFINWNDGNTDNPRQVTVTSNLNYMANFGEADGLKVVFDQESWKATTILGADYSQQANIVLIEGYKDYERNDTPHISGYAGCTPGTYTHDQQDYNYFFYYENDDDYTVDEDGSLSGRVGSQLPNWQPTQGFTVNVTAIDLNAKTISGTASGNLFSLPEYLSTQTQVTKHLEITFNNAQWDTAEKSAKMSKSPKATIL